MKRVLLGIAALALSATVASAAQIKFEVLESRWDNVSGGAPIAVDNTFAGGTQSVDWGTNCNFSAGLCSGYDFTSVGSVTAAPSTPFILGNFQHRNNPIGSGSGIDAVDLFIRGNLFVDAGSGFNFVGSRTFGFEFDHNETPNSVFPCEAPSGNQNGCADLATVTTLASTEVLAVEDQLFTLSILGFRQNGIFNTTFISPEGGTSVAEVVGSFTVSQVPLPAPVVLLISALLGLGFLARRKTP